MYLPEFPFRSGGGGGFDQYLHVAVSTHVVTTALVSASSTVLAVS